MVEEPAESATGRLFKLLDEAIIGLEGERLEVRSAPVAAPSSRRIPQDPTHVLDRTFNQE